MQGRLFSLVMCLIAFYSAYRNRLERKRERNKEGTRIKFPLAYLPPPPSPPVMPLIAVLMDKRYSKIDEHLARHSKHNDECLLSPPPFL